MPGTHHFLWSWSGCPCSRQWNLSCICLLGNVEIAKFAKGPTGVAAQALSWGQAGTRAQVQRPKASCRLPHSRTERCGSVPLGDCLHALCRNWGPFPPSRLPEGRPLPCSPPQPLAGHCHPCRVGQVFQLPWHSLSSAHNTRIRRTKTGPFMILETTQARRPIGAPPFQALASPLQD